MKVYSHFCLLVAKFASPGLLALNVFSALMICAVFCSLNLIPGNAWAQEVETVARKRPNVVWILSEDNSMHYLSHFFPGGAKAPNIEKMAREGFTFDHAFSNAPVCSVARTTLATMCYGPRIGTQFHRRYQLAPMPSNLKMFPGYLRDAGYYTTNNSKKDYNAVEGQGVWDESSRKATWRNRPQADQPFFHMETHGQSHEGSLHFSEAAFQNEKTKHDPATVALADYMPDTPKFRYTFARYLDRMQTIDELVGKTLKKLSDDGLLENTFVFYFGDHGGVLPRSKGYIYESGTHVPLVVRIPENFRHLVDGERGTREQAFVEFVDFGATVLNLAGVELPSGIDGKPFLGAGVTAEDLKSRNETLAYADRFDEKYDLVRAIRKGRFQYIRNYQPYLPDGLENIYRYKMLAFKEWKSLFRAGKLEGPAARFFQPKQSEELYDVIDDPHQVNNLADDPQHRETLEMLRGRLTERLKSLPDLSFYPESFLVKNAMENPVRFGRKNKIAISRLIDLANLALVEFEKAKPTLATALVSENEMERYWAAMVCAGFGRQAKSLAELARPLLKDKSEVVRIRAAEFFGQLGDDPRPTLIALVNQTDDAIVGTEALNSIVWFKDFFPEQFPVKRSEFDPRTNGADMDDRLNYINGVPYPPKKKRSPKPRKVPAKGVR